MNVLRRTDAFLLAMGLCGALFLVVALLMWKRPHLVPLFWMVPYTQAECGGEGFDPQTLAALNEMRTELHVRFRIRSGYRSPEANEAAGGVGNSQHLRGLAVDLSVPHRYRSDLYVAAKSAGFTAFGWGNSTVHVDRGPRRWWTYDDEGRHVGGAERYEFIDKAPENFQADFL